MLAYQAWYHAWVMNALPLAAFDVVAIGASLGGIQALQMILSGLPREFPASIIVVQHRSPRYQSHLTRILGGCCTLPISDACDGDYLEPGMVSIAPPNRHLTLASGGRLRLSATDAPPVQFTRPAVDPLFFSVAEHCRERAVAVVLTGMQRDGAAGACRVKEAGGRVLVQDPRTAQASGMPLATIAATPVDHILPLDGIADALTALVMVSGAASFLSASPSPPTAAPLSLAAV
jgi:two-component system chemotaxis response regulator CheB